MAIYITLRWTPESWLAQFQGHEHICSDTLLPLPFTGDVPFPVVKRDLEERFPKCFVSGSLRIGRL